MKEITKNQYLCRMLPHLLPARAKELHITPKDVEVWKRLKKELRSYLLNRYATSSPEQVKIDVSYERAGAQKCKEKKEAYLKATQEKVQMVSVQDFDIVTNSTRVERGKKTWIEMRRKEYLLNVDKYEREFASICAKEEIKVKFKMPFVIDGNIYFSDVYLPQYKLAIEIDSPRTNRTPKCEHRKNRDLALAGIKRIILLQHQAVNPKVVIETLNKHMNNL